MRGRFDSIYLGSFLGMIAPGLAFLGYYLIYYSYMSLQSFWKLLELGHSNSPLVSLCVVVNLLIFFIFIWTNKFYSARGVLLATFIYAGLVFFLKFFT